MRNCVSWIGKELVACPSLPNASRSGFAAASSELPTRLLGGRQFEFRQEQEILLFLLYKNVQTGPEDYPVSFTVGTGARRPGPAADIR